MHSVISKTVLLLAVIFSIPALSAVKIVECEDSEGRRSFQKVCPPETQEISAKEFSTTVSPATPADKNNIKATIYMIPDCEACSDAKELLTARNIQITEKNVNGNIELQKELTELNGSLKVPTIIIGKEILIGYNRSKIIDALKAAGYKEMKKAPKPSNLLQR